MTDLIDREVVFEEMSCTRPSPKDRPQYLQWLADIKAILKVPLVKTERKDKWICKYLPASIGSKVLVEVNICSNCGHVVDGNDLSNFCSVCGCDMRGGNNE